MIWADDTDFGRIKSMLIERQVSDAELERMTDALSYDGYQLLTWTKDRTWDYVHDKFMALHEDDHREDWEVADSDFWPKVIQEWADLSEDDLLALLDDPEREDDHYTPGEVALRKHLPDRVIARILDTDGLAYKFYENTERMDLVRALLQSPERWKQRLCCRRLDNDPDVMRFAARSDDEEMRMLAARSEAIRIEDLTCLAADSERLVRGTVASRRDCPQFILEFIANTDTDEAVRNCAAKRLGRPVKGTILVC